MHVCTYMSMYVCLYVLYIVQNLCGIKFFQSRDFCILHLVTDMLMIILSQREIVHEIHENLVPCSYM